MHYSNGRAAVEGDFVVSRQYKNVIAGRIHSLNAQATTCNGQISHTIMGGTSNVCVTVGECLHAEDALGAFEVANPKAEPAKS